MSEIIIPIGLTFVGFIAAFATYRGIRRGGARFYTLEREAILRRASFTLMGSVLLFLGAIGILIYQHQQRLTQEAAAGEMVDGFVATTLTPVVERFPPTASVTPTPDLSIPTATPTPIICRAVVEGTFGDGLTLRETPGGEEIDILAEASVLTLLEDGPEEVNGFIWRKVRTVFGDEGWVAQDFITIGASCE